MPGLLASLRRSATLKPLLGLALVAVMSGLTAWTLHEARDYQRRNAEQQLSNLTTTLERTIEHTAESLDLSLRSAALAMELPGMAALDPAVRQQILFDASLAAEGLGGVFILDERGNMLYQSRPNMPPGLNRADRAYFAAHRASTDDGLLVTGPVRGLADDQWTLIFSRRLSHPDGSFAGVVAGGIHVQLFNSLFDSLDLDPDALVALITEDGTMVARRPAAPDSTGRDVRGAPAYAAMVRRPGGTFEAVTRGDGRERLFAYRRVAGFPLIVSMAVTTERVYGAWSRRARIIGGIAAAIGGCYLLLAHALRRELRNRIRAEDAAVAAQAEAEHLAGALSHALARREALINTTADAMILARIDDDGTYRYEEVNPVWAELNGIAAADAAGRAPHEILPDPVGGEVLAAWQACVRNRAAVKFSFQVPAANQPAYWDAIVCPVLEADGSIRRVVGTARDVTEQRSLEHKLQQTQRMEALGRLTSGIAHDFNNLLQTMLGALEVTSDAAAHLDADGRDSLEIASEAARRGASLVHQLLAFSRKQVLTPTRQCPGQLVDEVASLLRAQLGGRHRLEIAIGHGAGLVIADPVQLRRCLVDLVLNAQDAVPGGGVLRLSVCRAEPADTHAAGVAAGDYVRFVVEDEGTGIPAETLAQVFEPFFTTKDIGKGVGLGLSMIQGFARQSGGEATIESAVGIGTAVSLWLPRVEGPEPGQMAAADHTLAGARHGRLLVVDDEQAVRQTLALFLRKAGYAAVVVDSGEAALALLAGGERFDGLITDQSMPGITGTELLEQVAVLLPDLPGMIITGFDRVTGMERLDGRVAILNKPFQRAVFLRQVDALLRPPASRGAGGAPLRLTASVQVG